MGYDLEVIYCPYSLTAGTTAHQLMNKLINLLSDQHHDEREYQCDADWYAAALEYLYFEDDYVTPLGYSRKPRDCRGCYSHFVKVAYVLSYVFVWNVIDALHNRPMMFVGDDVSGTIHVYGDEGGIHVTITNSDQDKEMGVEMQTIEVSEFRKQIRSQSSEDEEDTDEDTDEDTTVPINLQGMCKDDVYSVAESVQNSINNS